MITTNDAARADLKSSLTIRANKVKTKLPPLAPPATSPVIATE
jgi:hypothetical protein